MAHIVTKDFLSRSKEFFIEGEVLTSQQIWDLSFMELKENVKEVLSW